MELWLGKNNAPIKNEGTSAMNIVKYFSIVLNNFKANIHALGKYNFEDMLFDLQKHNKSILRDLNICKKNLIELYYESHEDEKKLVQDELNFIKEAEEIEVFPYPQIKKIQHEVIADLDKKLKLPFVIHNGKRLYFAKDISTDAAKRIYKNYIERENLLGGGYTTKAPHQYQTDDFKIEQNDVLLDIGCAEALLALDCIEKVKKAYLFECDERWLAPLKATFEPYKEKVVIVPKFVSNTDSKTSTTLDSIFNESKGDSFFIKMDIEGEEEKVLLSSKKFLESQNNIKIACCTYHKAHHAEAISKFLKSLNYNVEFSDGYMLFLYDSHVAPPYFRRGLLRAHK